MCVHNVCVCVYIYIYRHTHTGVWLGGVGVIAEAIPRDRVEGVAK